MMNGQVSLEARTACETMGNRAEKSANSKTLTLGRLLRAAADFVIRAYKSHKTDAALMRLNEYQLRDMGLERTQDGNLRERMW
ncbi:hypothetical protein [Thalassospira sp. MCCC 1A03138]|uniref:hypothetical protein n=1 Tax=Thalassospira sp. MCCC 1A03138 TaxID=1470576 RepID=UPI000A1EFEBC|nr:hypothetical protein [Thalassospira sp. MCCC 1A03138]OSQ32119.1 hypothetical protein TH468_00145 [Thalassospira sp. MCCC 1A03138]